METDIVVLIIRKNQLADRLNFTQNLLSYDILNIIYIFSK